MNKKDLLIDKYYQTKSTGKIAKFVGWVTDKMVEVEVSKTTSALLSWEGLEPIPLTEEWLFELGFKKEEESNFYKKNINHKGRIWINIQVDGGVGCEIGTLAGYSAGFVDCKHIHQLQNLYFILTGEELTFKIK
jgi:hypothetical protein